jgi:UDP-N-acetylmuramate--alanine ligase
MTRDRTEIGAGLEPARRSRPIRPGERIHVVGVAGAGASAAALHAHWAGAEVSGCDAGGASPYTAALTAAGVPITAGHAADHVAGPHPPDRLAVTKALTAIDPNHPELAAARAQGIPLEPWQQVIADAAHGRTLIAVAGTHGKSTTAGWLVHVLAAAGRDPSAFVGALLPPALTGGLPATARQGSGADFVVEADEYAGNFDAYRPRVAAITNVDWDHPDVFADRGAVERAIADWLVGRGVAWGPDAAHDELLALVVNVGDPGATGLLERLEARPPRVVGVAVDAPGAAADRPRAGERRSGEGSGQELLVGRVVEAVPQSTLLAIDGLARGRGPAQVRLPLAGVHNAANALVVAGTAMVLGVPPEAIAAGLESFPGVGRRLERKGQVGDVVVYDDYGHHPSAIRATLEAVRQREPGRPVWAVYEPLTFHRTAALIEDFAEALAEADRVVVADIWAGRDPDTTVSSSAALAAAVAERAPTKVVAAPGSVEATAEWLAGAVRPGDVVLVMGGGRSYRIAELLLDLIGQPERGRSA